MSKWELRTEGCKVPLARDIESGEWIGHSEVAEYFVAAHNAVCDHYEARIAELDARLAQTENDRFQLAEQWQQLSDKMDRIQAIAEGRDNG